MLHCFMFALASLLPQDGAPAPATPPAPPQESPQVPAPETKPAPDAKPASATKPPSDKKQASVAAKAATKPAKPLVVPTPKIKEPETPSYRVSVRMPGNRRFTGVIMRDRLFNDMVRAGAHNTKEVYFRSEKFTLRFVDGVDGDVTLRWNQIQKLDVREILDATGLRTVEEEYHRLMILKKETDEAERAKAEAEAAKNGTPKDGTKPADGGKPSEGGKGEDLDPLLAEFNPDQGWSPKRKEQVEWRRTVVGTAPDKAEQRFLDVYAEWLPLYNAWQLTHAPKSPDAKDGETKDPPKSDAKEKDEPKKDDVKKDDAPAKRDDVKDAPAPKEGGGNSH